MTVILKSKLFPNQPALTGKTVEEALNKFKEECGVFAGYVHACDYTVEVVK